MLKRQNLVAGLIICLILASQPASSTLSAYIPSVYNGQPAWSPDGNWIAYSKSTLEGSDIWLMRSDGTDQANLTNTHSTNNFHPVWSPDGQQIAFISQRSGNDDIWVMEKDGNNLKNLTVDNLKYDTRPLWSPDGRYIAIESTSANSQYRHDIRVIDMSDFHIINLTGGSDYTFRTPTWSPDSKSLASVARIPSDGSRITEPVGVWVTSIENLGSNELIPSELRVNLITWSPKGDYIAMNVFEDSDWDIWLMDMQSFITRNMTEDSPAIDSLPVWSPDGSTLAFTSLRTGNSDIWLLRLDSSSPLNWTSSNPGYDSFPAWSPDGSKLAFESSPDQLEEDTHIWVIDFPSYERMNLTAPKNP